MPNVVADSSDPNISAVEGVQTGEDGTGVLGIGQGNGVLGQSKGSKGFAGVRGESDGGPGVSGASVGSVDVDARTQTGPAAVRAINAGNGPGVFGTSLHVGVFGTSTGTEGFSGVHGESNGGPGVSGASVGSVGVDARTQTGPAAVRAINAGNGPGVFGTSLHVGVFGTSTGTEGFSGVHGESNGGPGVSGASSGSVGVDARTKTGPAAVRAVHEGNGLAGLFQGNVHISGNLLVDGDVQLTGAGADLAEQFSVVGTLDAEPGSVVVVAGHDQIRVSDTPYDRRVAGIVSGAGDYRPAIVLDKQLGRRRRSLALTGKVWCKVDADCGSVEIGDMLTTSPTPGHAMLAADPARAFGAVIGKALGSLKSGCALVPVLVALQ
jgi:hypothetical protein